LKTKSFNGKYLVITILALAVIFSLALSVSVKSIVTKMNTEDPGDASPIQDVEGHPGK